MEAIDDTFGTVAHAYSNVHHCLMRSARVNEMRQGFPSAGRVRGAFAGLYDFYDPDTLDGRHPVQLRGPRTAVRLREAFLGIENTDSRTRSGGRKKGIDGVSGISGPTSRTLPTASSLRSQASRNSYFIRAVRSPARQYRIYNIRAARYLRLGRSLFGTRFLSGHAGHLIILAAG